MKKNLALISLFVFLCISAFLNLAAFGERIRLNGNIEELNKGEEYYFNYVNAQSDLNNALYLYCQNQKDINVATLKNDDKKLMEEVEKMKTAVADVNEATDKVEQARQERLDFINSAKYVSKVEMPYNRIIELPAE